LVNETGVVDGPIIGTGGSLNLNTGVISGTSTFGVYGSINSSAPTNNGLDFDGVNDYLDLTTFHRNISSQVTVGCWVRTSTTGTSQFLVSKYVGVNGFLLFMDTNGKAKIDGKGTSGTYYTSGASTTSINDGQMNYVVGTAQ